MTSEEVLQAFGFKPETVGLRHRGFWIISEPDDDDLAVGAKGGDLIVKARDGGGNSPDCSVGRYRNYIGTTQDDFDSTYRYYYFKPLSSLPPEPEPSQSSLLQEAREKFEEMLHEGYLNMSPERTWIEDFLKRSKVTQDSP